MTNTHCKNELIAKRYAQSLIELYQDGKISNNEILKSLNIIEGTLSTSKQLNEFLLNPLISSDDKKEVIEEVFANELDILILNFIKILIEKERFYIFSDIVKIYNTMADKINNISRVDIISAIELNEETKNKIKSKLETRLNKSVSCSWDVDSSIIAGLVIRRGDDIIDTSLKYKLENLSKSISK